MTNLKTNRRTFLTSALATSAATPLIGLAAPARAAAELAPFRALYRFSIGAMRITIIDDARFTFPAPMFAMNQPEGSMAKFLANYGLPTDTVSAHMQITLVETGGHKVLLDAGMGDITFPGNDPDNGRLLAGLASIGVTPDDITDVIISHGHPDHIGGCTLDGQPCFPNATYHIPPDELEFWTQKPGDEQNFMNTMIAVGNAKLSPLQGLIKTYGDGDKIVPGIAAVAAPGHTLGHHAFLLEDGGASLLHLMDAAVHYLVGPQEPDWALAVEMAPDIAAATRRKLFRTAADSKTLVAGYHFPFPGIGRIIETGDAWRFVPMQVA